MDCSTIIVSYNTFELTREAVSTALEAAPGLEHEIIVVDNASPDGSAERLRHVFPRSRFENVHVIANADNVGFSRANNIGAAEAQGNVLFFLNPDTRVLGNTIATLHSFVVATPDAGAVGPLVLNPDGTRQTTTRRFYSVRRILGMHYPFLRALFNDDAVRVRSQNPKPIPVDIVDGCAICIRKDTFETIGRWDDSYYMYAEEDELCRAAVEAGYVNYLLPTDGIIHFRGSSTESNRDRMRIIGNSSILMYLKRHHSRALVYFFRISGIVSYGLRTLSFFLLSLIQNRSSYRSRGKTASRLFRWFLLDFS